MIYEFTPTQDLHGYSEPWAPGSGKNLLDPDIDAWKVRAGSAYRYILNLIPEDTTAVMSFYDKDTSTSIEGTYLGYSGANLDSVSNPDPAKWGIKNGVVTPSIDNLTEVEGQVVKMRSVMVYPNSEAVFNALFSRYNIMVELADSSSDVFEPYANICPIEGFNIWDPSQDQMIQVYSGYVDANANKLYLHPVYEEYDGEELVGPWMSSMDKYTEDGTPTTGAFVVDFGGEVSEYDITDFMLQTLLDSLGLRRFFASGAMLLNSLMDQAQGRVRSEAELLNRSLPLHVIAIGEDLPTNLTIKKPVSDVLPGLPGKIKI